MFVRLFRIKASESPRKKLINCYLQRGKIEKKERKRALYNLRMPKLLEIFTTVAIVCHRYERLQSKVVHTLV